MSIKVNAALARKLGMWKKREPKRAKHEKYPIAEMCRAMGLPIPVPEYQFAPPRKWRFDFAWPNAACALEVDGGTWTKSRHHHGTGLIKDRAKLNQAAILGWRVLRVGPEDVASGAVYELIRKAVGMQS